MATIKSYSDFQQSKKLAEILPLESADMHLTNSSIKGEMYIDEFKPVLVPYLRAKDSLDAYSKIVNSMIAWEVIPCWSLAALLNIINNNYYTTLYHDGVAWNIDIIHHDNVKDKHSIYTGTPIDTCYEMIIKLHEQNII